MTPPQLRRDERRADRQAAADRRRQRDQPPHPDATARRVGHGADRRRRRGAEALGSCAPASAFDVAVLDMQMPEMDGLDLGARDPRSDCAGDCRSILASSLAGAT